MPKFSRPGRFDFFGVGVGCALKNLFLKPRLRGGVSQLLSLPLAAAELCNKMLFVGLRRRRWRRRNCKKTAEFALCHPSEIQSLGSNMAPIKKKKAKKKKTLFLLDPHPPSDPPLSLPLPLSHVLSCVCTSNVVGGKGKKKTCLPHRFLFWCAKSLRFPS